MIPSTVRWIAAAILLVLVATGCSKVRETAPDRTATEQYLLSTATDRAVSRLIVKLPAGTKVFIDPSRFEAYDRGYAIGAVRDRFLASGVHLTDNRSDAQAVVEIRSGALSTNESEALVGLPAFSIPIPLTGDLDLPEVALLKQVRRRGLAKIGFTAYWIENGALADRADPVIGVSGYNDWTFLGIGWHDGDVVPDQLPPEARRRDREKNGSAEADP